MYFDDDCLNDIDVKPNRDVELQQLLDELRQQVLFDFDLKILTNMALNRGAMVQYGD